MGVFMMILLFPFFFLPIFQPKALLIYRLKACSAICIAASHCMPPFAQRLAATLYFSRTVQRVRKSSKAPWSIASWFKATTFGTCSGSINVCTSGHLMVSFIFYPKWPMFTASTQVLLWTTLEITTGWDVLPLPPHKESFMCSWMPCKSQRPHKRNKCRLSCTCEYNRTFQFINF